MTAPDQDPRRIIHKLLVYGALLTIVVTVFLHFLLFRPYEEALKLLLPSILASLIILLMAYAFRHTLLKEADSFLTEDSVKHIAAQIVNEVRSKISPGRGLALFERWEEIPWRDVLGEAKKIEFFASYMDTWLIQTADLLQQILTQDGTVRAFLPNPDNQAADRVLERFPEYSTGLIRSKIFNTCHRLQRIFKAINNKQAILEIYLTDVFCMHCLIQIDSKYLILSPFDHFRRAQVESPAFIVDLHSNPRVAQWARKELDGFRASGKLWCPDSGSKPPAAVGTPISSTKRTRKVGKPDNTPI